MAQNIRRRAALAGASVLMGAAMATAAAAPAASAATTTAPAATAAQGIAFGPAGFSHVKIGMSIRQAEATGRLKLTGSDPCARHYTVKGFPRATVVVGRQKGVVLISAPQGAVTHTGIRVGSTLTQVRRAHPDVKVDFHGYYIARATGVARYEFEIDGKSKKVVGVYLIHKTPECFN